MGKRRERPTPHAEGEHGPKTQARIIQQLESRPAELPAAARADLDRIRAAFGGKRRLVEDRQQHDEGEKNSERARLFEMTRRGRADGPSDNSGNLHGVLGSREHRADYKPRRRDGLRDKGRP